jgi:uncharacterized lipoprotein YmbA
MKKLLLITAAITLIGCSEEEQQEQDCNCDRVVEASTFNIVGTPQNPAINYYTVYTTINDCTGIQRQKDFTTTNNALSPKVGQCR